MKKLLICRPDGIGDFVIFTAVLEEYVKLYPGYEIDLLCHEKVVSLAEAVPFINKIVPIKSDLIFRKRNPWYTILALSKVVFLNYDFLIYPVYSRTRHDDLLIKFIKAKEKIAFDGDDANDENNSRIVRNKFYTTIINGQKNKSAIERNFEFIQALGSKIEGGSLHPKIWFLEQDDSEFQRIQNTLDLHKGYVCLFPGAGNAIRQWPASKWKQVVEFLLKNGLKIVLLGSQSDFSLISQILDGSNNPEKLKDLSGKTNLRLTAKIIQHARLLVSTETCAVHIAAALDVPNICIMGGGHFGVFYPYGDLSKNRIVYHQMECFGCNWKCIHDKSYCIYDLNEHKVLDEIKSALCLI